MRSPAWMEEMSAIQSDIRRERREIASLIPPEIDLADDLDIDRRKKVQKGIITRYEQEVIPRMKRESLIIFILHILYYGGLTTFAILSFLKVEAVTDILGAVGLTTAGTTINLPNFVNRIKQTIKDRPILDKSVTFLKDKLDQVDTAEEIDDLEETLDVISSKALFNYNQFIKVLVGLQEKYPLKHEDF